MRDMSRTREVSHAERSSDASELQPMNILHMSVVCAVSQSATARETRELQLRNTPRKLSVREVSQPDTSRRYDPN